MKWQGRLRKRPTPRLAFRMRRLRASGGSGYLISVNRLP
jgi:hypothetical protein